MLKPFVLTQQHLVLLKHAYVDWSGDISGSPGAPAIDPKRPYGSKDWISTIAQSLGHPVLSEEDEDDPDLLEKWEKPYRLLHEQTGTALQICLCTQQFKPGVYLQKDEYDERSWEWVGEVESADEWTKEYETWRNRQRQRETEKQIRYHQEQVDRLQNQKEQG